MPVFSLKLQADSENIASISSASVGRWCVVLSQGGEESGEVYIIEGQEVEVPGGKGVANFVMKFKGGSSCNVNVVAKTEELDADDFNAGPVTVCELECRGCDVVSWRPTDDWTVVSEGGTSFEEVDLSEDFDDYDEDNDASVRVFDLQTSVEAGGASSGGGKKKSKKKKK